MTLCKTLIIAVSTLFLATSASADSAGNRDKSTVLLGLTPVGIHGATIGAPPFTVGAFLGKEWMVGLDMGSKSYSATSGTATATATASNQGLYGRYFLGNSFNLSAGYHMRNYSATATATSGSATSTVTLDAKASVLNLGLGNHWMMDWGLYLGADWVLAGAALSKSTNATVTSSSGGGVSAAKADVEKIGDVVNVVSAAAGFVVFTIGFAF